MSVSYQNRGLSELHLTSTRNFGLQADALPAIHQLNLNHNALRSLECPFAGVRGTETEQNGVCSLTQHTAPLLPLRPETTLSPDTRSRLAITPAEVTGSVATTSKLVSLEEEGSGLRALTSLAQLFVSYNQLRTLRGLCGAAQTLTTLIATHNHLTSLDGMQACRHLTYIDLSHNAIDSLKGLPLTFAAVDVDALANAELFTSLLSAVPSSQRATTPPMPPRLAVAVAATGVTVNVTDSALALSFVEEVPDASSSLTFSCRTSTGETHRLQFQGTTTAAAAARRSASTNTSLLYHVEETSLTSAGTPASLALEEGRGITSAEGNGKVERSRLEVPEKEVVLILSHNRLRGRALAALLWVDGCCDGDVSKHQGGEGGQNGCKDSSNSNSLLLRPWSTALTNLDLSHNFIEDINDIRRLFSYVPCPFENTAAVKSQVATSAGEDDKAGASSTVVVHAPVLSRLRRLDVSGNPCLVNGSLAKNIMSAAAAAKCAHPLQGPITQLPLSATNRLSVRRGSVKPSDVVNVSQTVVVPPVTFGLRYTLHALADAVRTSAASYEHQHDQKSSSAAATSAAGFSSIAAAQPVMEAALHRLAEDWRDTPLLNRLNNNNSATLCSSSSLSVLFALFSPAERRRLVEAALIASQHRGHHTLRKSVLLYGAEVTVFAAVLQQHGARLGEVLCVPVPDPPDKTALLLSSSSIAEAVARRSPVSRPPPYRAASATSLAGRNTTVEVFLTPPPKWGSETSTSATFLQTSLLSSGSPLPRGPSLHNALSPTALRGFRSDGAKASSEYCERRSDGGLTSAVETSSVGYRLYVGQRNSTREVDANFFLEAASNQDTEKAVGGSGHKCLQNENQMSSMEGVDVATPVRAKTPVSLSSATVTPAASSPAKLTSADDAVTLQLYREEVAVLRRRFRELQRQTRDQACLLQQHETAMRDLKAEVAEAKREREMAQTELAKAQQEIQRLQADVRTMRE